MLQAVQEAPLPPMPPAPPTPVIVTGPDGRVDAMLDPHAVLMALQAQRDELRDQVNQLQEKREQITEQIRENRSQGLDISGLEQRLKATDASILDVEQQLDQANKAVAKQSAVPNAVQEEPRVEIHRDGPPDGAFVLGGFFIVFVLMPIAVAFSRRLWRRGGGAPATLPPELNDRLRGIEQAVESVAVEVERIGEGQRFMSRVFTDRTGGAAEPRALGEGAAPAIDVAQRHKVAEPR